MCLDPVSLATAAVSGLGSLVSASEQNASNRAMVEARNKATTDELARQKGFQTQAGDVFSGALGRFSPANYGASLDAAKAGAGAFLRGNQPMAAGSITLKGAPPVAADYEAKTIADAFGRNADRSTTLGNLTGYGQQGFDDAMALSGSGRKLDTINNFSRGSASLTPLEREVAGNNAYRPPSGLGDILSFAGNLGSFKSGAGTLPTASIFGNKPLDIRPMVAR